MILILIVLAVLGYIGFSFIVANEMTKRMAPRLDASAAHVSENYEDVEFDTSDGLTLKGWLFKADSNRLIIMVPGLTQNRINDSYYAMQIGKELVGRGYNLLMYDPRATGLSEGNRVSYGNFEVADILGAVEFAKERGFKPENIAIIGDSTGAITVLMAADQLNEVGAMVIDTAATDYKPFIIKRLWTEKKIPAFFGPGIFFFTDTIFNLKIGNVKPANVLPQVPERKFLYLHANEDEIFPISEAEKLLELSSSKSTLVIFPEARHIETFKSNPDLYIKEVVGFLKSELGK